MVDPYLPVLPCLAPPQPLSPHANPRPGSLSLGPALGLCVKITPIHSSCLKLAIIYSGNFSMVLALGGLSLFRISYFFFKRTCIFITRGTVK